MTLSIQTYAQNTAILAYSLNNKKYERNIRRVLERISCDKNIVSVHMCLACTLQRWNKMTEGYSHKEALSLAQKEGDIVESQLDKYAGMVLGDKYKGVFRWYNYTCNPSYLSERDNFYTLCSRSTTLRILNDLIKCSNREDLLRQERSICEIFDDLLQRKKWLEIPWETAMAASIFEYAISFIKKHNPKNHPIIYDKRPFVDLLNTIFNNSYEYLAEEAVVAYKFWDYNKLLYLGKITPILSKAYEEFVLKQGHQNKLWWQNMELADYPNNNLIKDHIDSYLKNQKVQVKKECILEFTNLITSLLKLITSISSKEIRYLLRLLATSLLADNKLK